jgi:hypothetical protein
LPMQNHKAARVSNLMQFSLPGSLAHLLIPLQFPPQKHLSLSTPDTAQSQYPPQTGKIDTIKGLGNKKIAVLRGRGIVTLPTNHHQ